MLKYALEISSAFAASPNIVLVLGTAFWYFGLMTSLPRSVDIGVQNALLRGKYEREEAAMIRNIANRLAVIELGGSLGSYLLWCAQLSALHNDIWLWKPIQQ